MFVVDLQESVRVVRLTTVRRDTGLVTENEDIRRFAQTLVFLVSVLSSITRKLTVKLTMIMQQIHFISLLGISVLDIFTRCTA